MITSQGGSVEWRFTQNPTGHDYGHHMSKVREPILSSSEGERVSGSGKGPLMC